MFRTLGLVVTQSAPLVPGNLPGAHLGLRWSDLAGVSTAEIVDLNLRCAAADSAPVLLPGALLEKLYRPSSPDHVSVAGRSADGTLRALATVRAGRTPISEDVAIRAIVDPPWRGRGIGRSLLTWQDGLALEMLTACGRPSMIAVPIGAHLMDRRRLYTAGGLSFSARLELRTRVLGDSPVAVSDHLEPPPPAPGWITRRMREEDWALLEDLHRRECKDRHSFVARAVTVPDLVGMCDPRISRVAEQDGVPLGAVLALRATGADLRPIALVVGLMLASDDERVALGLLAAAFQDMWAEGLHEVSLSLTPACRERWASPLEKMACTERGSDLLYGIEVP